MQSPIMQLSAWCETQLTIERCNMQSLPCAVERDEQEFNSGLQEMLYEWRNVTARAMADGRIVESQFIANATDYPEFWDDLAACFDASSAAERLQALAALRDKVHARIESEALEELRKER